MYVPRSAILYLIFSLLPIPLAQASENTTPFSAVKIPLAFERNQGQADSSVKFISQGAGYRALFSEQELIVSLSHQGDSQHTQNNTIRMQFVDGNKSTQLVGDEPLAFKTNYFIDDDVSGHITDISNYAKVLYRSIYPGIDLVYYGNQQQIEYDVVVAAGANPEQVKMRFIGNNGLTLSEQGDLIVKTDVGNMTFHQPIAYQEVNQQRVPVPVKYLVNVSDVQFELGHYDKTKPLVIDPIISYASFLWGAFKTNLAVDAAGNTYIVGTTNSNNLPVATGYKTTLSGLQDAYVVKLDSTGSKALYATYLGSRRANTFGNHIAVDNTGSAYVVGTTDATSYPVTSGAYMSTPTGAFLTKLNAAGNALVYSTYIPNITGAEVKSIAVDAATNFYLAGIGTITTTAGAYQKSAVVTPSSYVYKLDSAGKTMLYATYLGSGSAVDEVRGLAVDVDGNAYLTGVTKSNVFPASNAYQASLRGGSDAFVTKLNTTGSALVYSTYLGGTSDDNANAIALNTANEAFVVGQTRSADFPVTNGVFQHDKGYSTFNISNGFITKLNSAGNVLQYSSFIGGDICIGCMTITGINSDRDKALTVAVDSAGYAYVGGLSRSQNFPLVDPIQANPSTSNGNPYYVDNTNVWPFLAKVSPLADRLVFSIFAGKSDGADRALSKVAIDAQGHLHAMVHFLGNSCSPMFLTSGSWVSSQTSGCMRNFLFKISPPRITTTLRAASNFINSSTPLSLSAYVENLNQSGVVTFAANGNIIGNVPIANGMATLTTQLSAGVYKVTANYSIDGAESLPIFVTVNN